MNRYPGIFVISVLAAAALQPALGWAFPTKPLRIIVPFPPRGGADIVTRIVAQRLYRWLAANGKRQPIKVSHVFAAR